MFRTKRRLRLQAPRQGGFTAEPQSEARPGSPPRLLIDSPTENQRRNTEQVADLVAKLAIAIAGTLWPDPNGQISFVTAATVVGTDGDLRRVAGRARDSTSDRLLSTRHPK